MAKVKMKHPTSGGIWEVDESQVAHLETHGYIKVSTTKKPEKDK